jgi:uncharacterized cupin superfamily protein
MALIEVGSFNVDLEPSPIEPSWIIEGNPVARSRVLSTSEDRTAQTIVWHCTEGRFNWYYDIDETIMIMEGSIVLESDGMPPKRYGPRSATAPATSSSSATARMPNGMSKATSRRSPSAARPIP